MYLIIYHQYWNTALTWTPEGMRKQTKNYLEAHSRKGTTPGWMENMGTGKICCQRQERMAKLGGSPMCNLRHAEDSQSVTLLWILSSKCTIQNGSLICCVINASGELHNGCVWCIHCLASKYLQHVLGVVVYTGLHVGVWSVLIYYHTCGIV